MRPSSHHFQKMGLIFYGFQKDIFLTGDIKSINNPTQKKYEQTFKS